MVKNPESAQSNPADNTPAKVGGTAQPKPEEARASSATPDEQERQPAGGGQPSSAGHAISERKGQFLIAARRSPGLMAMGLAPLQIDAIENMLRASPDIEVVDTVGPKNIVGMLAEGMGEAPTVLVARMPEQKAAILQQQAQGRLIVERDQALVPLDISIQEPMLVAAGATPTAGPGVSVRFVVLGKDNQPVKDAEVTLFGSMLPATGVTDGGGQVTLTLYGETPRSIRSLYVKPKSDYWSFYQQQPDISADEVNVVGVRPLSDWPSLESFPEQQVLGWGQRAMRLDQLPATYRGQGIKIAVIDSGAATTHEDLKKTRLGFDVINKRNNPNTWNEDILAHGSHCLGIVAGADNAYGIRGFAPDAEVHVCKLLPGGQISHLIDALEYCIEKQIDVVNLSLGLEVPSEVLEQQIQRAKRAGVACVVAAGNNGSNRVLYPGSSPNVLTVAAIGKLNEFPPDSYHSQTITPLVDANGFFSAKFTCFGPEVDVCAPGVAITSSVPPNNFAVWDGTSMAAPHVTGLAALVLAHRPDFQGPYRTRGAERVERLFQVIRASTRPINLGDPRRTGFGLPDVLISIGLQGMVGVNAQQQAEMYPFGAVYRGQMPSQAWMANPWIQGGQQIGGMNMASGFDPAYVAYHLARQMGNPMQGMAFGMSPQGFSPQVW